MQSTVKSNGHSTQDISPVLSIQEQIKALQAQMKQAKAAAKVTPFNPLAVTGREYKGNAMLLLKPNPDADEKSKFAGCMQFGKSKAKLIVALFADIKAFAESDSAPTEVSSEF